MATSSKVFRVFFSSSFKDMHAERDYLREHAFRRLDLKLKMLGYSLDVMDLRGSSEEDDTIGYEERVLQMCLRRVNDCKPRMIGVLGDRYGWIFYGKPEAYLDAQAYIRAQKVAFDIADRHGMPREMMQDISVTHLEILYGLLHIEPDRSFFYLRAPLPYAAMPVEERVVYAPDNPQKQSALKNSIMEVYAGSPTRHVSEYAASYTPHKPLTGFEALDALVYEDLWNSFQADMAAEPPDETTLHQKYFSGKAANTLELPLLQTLYARIEEGKTTLITGAAGSGKSVLMAQLYSGLQKANIPAAAFSAGIAPATRNEGELLRALSEQIFCHLTGCSIGEFSFPEKLEEQRQAFWDYLAEISPKGGKLVVFIDSIDSLSTRVGERNHLAFLPETLPPGIVFVLSTKIGTVDYFGKLPLEEVQAAPLDFDMAATMVKSIAGRFAKGLEREVVSAAAGRVAQAGGLPIYASILAEFLCQMTGQDYNAFTGDAAHVQWMLHQCTNMPLTVSEAYAKTVVRAQVAYGKTFCDQILGLMAISRSGVPFALIEAALGGGGSGFEVTAFELRDYLFGHLRQDIDLSWWEFEHQQFRQHCLAGLSPEARLALHRQVVETLDGFASDDAFKTDEYLYHCLHAGLPEKAVGFIATMPAVSQGHYNIFSDFLRTDEQSGTGFLKKALETITYDQTRGEGEETSFILKVITSLGGQFTAPAVSYEYLKGAVAAVKESAKLFMFAPVYQKKARLVYPLSFLMEGRQANAAGAYKEAIAAYKQCTAVLESFASTKTLTMNDFEIYIEVLLNIGEAFYDLADYFAAKSYFTDALGNIEAIEAEGLKSFLADKIRIEIFLARIAKAEIDSYADDVKKGALLEEAEAHYQSALSLCDEAEDAGALGRSKQVILEEMAGLGAGGEAQVQEALRLAKEQYRREPESLTAVLGLVSASESASKLLKNASFAREAFEILAVTNERIPGRPKVVEKLLLLASTIGALAVEEGSPESALEAYERTKGCVADYYAQTGDFDGPANLLLSAAEAAEQCGDATREGEYRERLLQLIDLEIEKQPPNLQEILEIRLRVLWETVLCYENRMKNAQKANEKLYVMEEILLDMLEKRTARELSLQMQLGHKLHALATMYYLSGERDAALAHWERAVEVFEDIAIFFPEEESGGELRARVYNEIRVVMMKFDDPDAAPWESKLGFV